MFKRQFKLNEADKAEITRQITEMQKADVTERSDDPDYNSPAFWLQKRMDKSVWSLIYAELTA